MMIHKTTPLRFNCTQCGACCYGDENDYIAANTSDLSRICNYLDISLNWLKRRYVKHHSYSLYSVRFDENGRCVFLSKDNSCRIYPVRPVQCRTYPWWPELLESKKAWNREASRCEGINQGQNVPISRIIAALDKQITFEETEECNE